MRPETTSARIVAVLFLFLLFALVQMFFGKFFNSYTWNFHLTK